MERDKERGRLFGQVVVDFINAETTDEASLKFFNTIREVFNFSSQFVTNAIKDFPRLSSLTPQSEHEKTLTELLNKERRIKEVIKDEFHFAQGGQILGYDFQKGTFTYRELYWSDYDVEKGGQLITGHSEPIESKIEALKEIIRGIEGRASGVSWNYNEPKELVENASRIAEISEKHHIPKARFSEIVELSEYYDDVRALHVRIGNTRTFIKGLLNEVLSGESLHKNEKFIKLMNNYNSECEFGVKVTEDDSITIENPDYTEDAFLDSHTDSKTLSPTSFNKYPFKPLLSISVIEFFRNIDRRKLKKCPYCDMFFMAKDIKRKKCYSDNCRKTHEREKKRKQREAEPDIYC